MKILLLFLLVACGHQEPDKMDLEDSDGDRIANAYEAQQSKFQAEFQPLNKIEGVLSLTENANNYEIAFSNFRDLDNEAYQKLTWREDKIPHYDYFTEFSRIIFKSSLPINVLVLDKMYTIKLKFESSEELPDYVYLVTDISRVKLTRLEKNTSIQVTGKTIHAILNKEAHFDLAKAENDSEKLSNIKAKSYRVYRHDGKETKIAYLSKDFTFNSYLESQNLINVRLLNHQQITVLDGEKASWWFRELSNGDKVLVFSNMANIKEYYLEGLQKSFNTLSRIEGVAQNTIFLRTENLNNTQKAVLRITPDSIRKRIFYERRYVSRSERRRTSTCVLIRKKISGEAVYEIDQPTMIGNLIVKIDQKEISLNQILNNLEEKFDDKGKLYWELYIEYTGQELSINLVSQPHPDTIYGDIDSSCRENPERKRPVHTEVSFGIAVKAYLED